YAARDSLRLRPTRSNERWSLCTLACWSQGPCGCWSIGSQDSQLSSSACRALALEPCLSPTRGPAPDHIARLAAPMSRFGFRVLRQVLGRLPQKYQESSRESLLCGRSSSPHGSVRGAAHCLSASQIQRSVDPWGQSKRPGTTSPFRRGKQSA